MWNSTKRMLPTNSYLTKIFIITLVIIIFIVDYHINGFFLISGLILLGFLIINSIYKLPIFAIFLIYFFGILPQSFPSTIKFGYFVDFNTLPYGLRVSDIILLIMIPISIIKAQKLNDNVFHTFKILLFLFSVVLFFGIVRNISAYGLSAPGEFRYRYLILALPIYVAISFQSQTDRKKLFKLLILLSLIMPLIYFPIIGFVKNWGFGPGERYFSSSISLGFLYGLTALFLGQKYNYISVKKIVLLFITALATFLIVVDSHRSVWLAAMVSTGILFLMKEIKGRSVLYGIIPLFALLTFVILATEKIGLNLFDYIISRGGALVDPMDDPTAAWRIAIWKAQLGEFLKNPLLGEGFGGYWEVYVPELSRRIDISPHSLYIQTLVKIGIIGLITYLVFTFDLFRRFAKRLDGNFRNDEYPLVTLGVIILFASHAYYVVYAFEYYSLLFIGLAAAVVLYNPSSETEDLAIE